MSDAGPTARILSGSIGMGHHTVAEVCAEALKAEGCPVEVVDCLEGLGGAGQRVGEFVFRTTFARPPLFDALHFSQLRAASALSDAMERASARRLTEFLMERTLGQSDLLLGVFATGAGAAGRLRRGRPDLHAVVFCTDATAHRLWMHPGVERYLVCSPMAAATVRQYQPRADVIELPPPVRAPFFSVPAREAARRTLGLPDGGPVVLLMAGGWGHDALVATAEALAAAGHQVVAVAGRNAKVGARLRRVAAAIGGPGIVIPLGYTTNIPEYMAAADVVVTTPGQTCHEARVVGRPMVLLDAVPGHGRENLLLEVTKGGATACSAHPAAAVAAVAAVLDGCCPPSAPWPVSEPAEWDRTFIDALGALCPSRRRQAPEPAI